jgi:hypothetical protein
LGEQRETSTGSKTRTKAVFKQIGSVQLPGLLVEVDAARHFSEALMARRPSPG